MVSEAENNTVELAEVVCMSNKTTIDSISFISMEKTYKLDLILIIDEGIHYDRIDSIDSIGRRYETRILYKRGLVRLSMFVKNSAIAKRFRQWVEDLIIDLDAKEKLLLDNSDQFFSSQNLPKNLTDKFKFDTMQKMAHGFMRDDQFDVSIKILEAMLCLNGLSEKQLSKIYFDISSQYLILGDIKNAIKYYRRLDEGQINQNSLSTILEMFGQYFLNRVKFPLDNSDIDISRYKKVK